MADLMDEIGDDLRQQQLKAFWQENGSWIIGSAILAVVMTAALSFWRGHQAEENMMATRDLLAVVKTADLEKMAAFANDSKKNHAAMARFAAAALHVQKKEPAQAVAIYREIENTRGVDSLYRDLAKLLGIGQRLDTADTAQLLDEVEPLTEEGNPWRFSALEMQALVYARAGKTAEAVKSLEQISASANAPDDARTRAMTLSQLYAGVAE